jgi:hypothetical protein
MIEGYPEAVTITAGDTLTLCVSTDHPRFRVDFFRQGANLDLMGSNEWQDGAPFARGTADQDWQWGRHEFTVPANWPSGVYIAMFFELDEEGNVVSAPEDTAIADGRSAKALFVVRRAAPDKTAPILYKVPLFTYQAYNDTNSPMSNMDGGSLYTGAAKVTLRRTGGGTGGTPWDNNTPDAYDGSSPRQTFAHWDAKFISWLEKNGYWADYCTDLDIHENPGNFLADYRLLLSVGHDEYWSEDMRVRVGAFIQHGGNVAFFSGNTCWWRIRLEDNNTAFGRDDNWPDDNRETRLTGVSYRHAGGWWDGRRNPVVGYTVQHAGHWVFEGTGLRDGDGIGNGADVALVGYECDGTQLSDQADVGGFVVPSFVDGTPPSFVILGVSRLGANWESRLDGDKAAATMGLYTNTGTVFTAATVDWARVLASRQDSNVERVTRNVLDRLSGRVFTAVMYLNRPEQPGSGRVMIVDYTNRQVPGQPLYVEMWGQNPLLDGWEDDTDWHAVGDFLGLGHDQVMYWNRPEQPGSGRVMIVDYSNRQVPGQPLYVEMWGQSPLLDGWEDDTDWHAVGDFLGSGHDQLMYWNRPEQPGSGRVMIVDYSNRQVPGQPLYVEMWGQSPLLDGWEDDTDWFAVGDFLGLGHDQLMYWNRPEQPGSGRVMIVDYSSRQVPGQPLYVEMWGQSPLLDGWEDDTDRRAVGDFLGLGHDQVMYWNRPEQPGSGRVMIVDYSSRQVPGRPLYLEMWGQNPLLDGWEDDTDWLLEGTFTARGSRS